MDYLICKKDVKTPSFTKGLRYAIKEQKSDYLITFDDRGQNTYLYPNGKGFDEHFDFLEV